MPEIEIRPAQITDLNTLLRMDHSYQTAYVWQMDRFSEKGQISIYFREVRLPRPVRIEYPNPPEKVAAEFAGDPGPAGRHYGRGAGWIYPYQGKPEYFDRLGDQFNGERRAASQGHRVGDDPIGPKLGFAAQFAPHGA